MSLTDFINNMNESSKNSDEFEQFREILGQLESPQEIYSISFVANT